ncbi:kelch domain-containing protein 3-like [Amblyomma americanum]
MWTVRLGGVPEGACYTSVSINGKIYSFGPDREDVDRTTRESVEVYVFDPATCQWNQLQTQSLPDGSPWHHNYSRTVVAYGDSAYLWSSRDYIERGSAVYRFDTRTMAWSLLEVSGIWPEFRFGQTACLVGSLVYLYGGWPVDGPPTPQIDFLDLKTLRWHTVTTRGELPENTMYHSASAIGDRMYVWGGAIVLSGRGTAYSSSLVYLDTSTSTWVRPRVDGFPPEGRADHATFVYNGELYVFGGLDFDRGRYFGIIHKYNPERSSWSVVTPKRSGPSARRFPGCCVIDNLLFVFGGRGLKSYTTVEQWMQSSAEETSELCEEALTDMHVLDFCPTLKTMCLMAVIDANAHVGHLPPAIKKEVSALTSYRSTSPSSQPAGSSCAPD